MRKTLMQALGAGCLAAAATQVSGTALAQKGGEFGLAGRFKATVGSINLDGWAKTEGLGGPDTKRLTPRMQMPLAPDRSRTRQRVNSRISQPPK